MKKKFLPLGLMLFTLMSCSKEKTLKNRLDESDWKATKAVVTINGRETDFTSTNINYHFDSNGSGKFTSTTSNYTFKWSTDGEHVVFSEMSNSPGSVTTFDLLDNDRKKQKWEANQTSGSNTVKAYLELEKQ